MRERKSFSCVDYRRDLIRYTVILRETHIFLRVYLGMLLMPTGEHK
ncbi:hypothetical protein PsalN5692_04115 (plasmid) [Piscirickettsia salmonis]|nr:hypothetical protein PsalN5692_03802 [Piscirickettsia salmonis]QGP52606.1 hypothetical protein PsalN5692_04115 [Piscirickettsia salmonis]QGP57282.1 hypothetical protein PsalSR1_04771 [Piscirickettsia salmonis]QGP61967.1 hypothetical protein PsalBI1_04609 [Piscirickettsia salmonis]QGP66817.1 hypothetical protein PsalMR5_04742 [Piscirickettsia salmonis]